SADLRALQILQDFSAAQLNQLSRNLTVLNVRKGEVIYRPGQVAENLYLLLDGAIGLSILGSKGSSLRLAVLAQGEFFGVAALIPGWRRVSLASAVRDSRIGEIPARFFVEKICGLSWKGFSNLTELTLKPLFVVSLRRALFLIEDLPNRVATVLWEYTGHPEARQKGGLLPLSLTHEEISALVGASRPRVSLALKQLEERGFFTRKGKQMLVQQAALGAYLRREYEILL
ncbi:MAG TPA: Crp/Fnr family transcriptional regulator, partial [Candidatus Binatia bacterium]|nr:Crp/Fnr family transcriptional regulator [Candidatus Binatia bacterium]